jgi:cytochrome P450
VSTVILYDLAERPEYITPIREEVEKIVSINSWTKSSVMKMRKLDSFVKEVLRYNTSARGPHPKLSNI